MDWKFWLLGIPTLVATVLQYIDPNRKLLAAVQVPSISGLLHFNVFGLLASLGWLALLTLGFHRLNGLMRELPKIRRTLDDQEQRMLKNINETGKAWNNSLREARADFEKQLSSLSRRLDDLDRLPDETAAFNRGMNTLKSISTILQEDFPIYKDGQIVKRWTKEEIRGLPESQRKKLKTEEPECWKWYLGGV
jgi:hypothetical protein